MKKPTALALGALALALAASADTTPFGTVATNTPIYTAVQADDAFVTPSALSVTNDYLRLDGGTLAHYASLALQEPSDGLRFLAHDGSVLWGISYTPEIFKNVDGHRVAIDLPMEAGTLALVSDIAAATNGLAAAALPRTAIQTALSGIDADNITSLQAAIERLAALIAALKGVGE